MKTKSSSYRGVFAAAAMVMLWAVAPGCVPSAGSYCKKVCECSACDEVAEASCVDNVGDASRRASGKSCGSQFDAYLSCVDGKNTCAGAALDAAGCETEKAALQECAGEVAFGSSCINVCTRVANECGSGNVDDCAPQCAQADQAAANGGCSAEYNAFMGCYDKQSDICSAYDSCYPESDAYQQCMYGP